jgi:hypothetical protein
MAQDEIRDRNNENMEDDVTSRPIEDEQRDQQDVGERGQADVEEFESDDDTSDESMTDEETLP